MKILLIDEKSFTTSSSKLLLEELKRITNIVHDNTIKITTRSIFKGGNPIFKMFNLILRGLRYGGTDMIFINLDMDEDIR